MKMIVGNPLKINKFWIKGKNSYIKEKVEKLRVGR